MILTRLRQKLQRRLFPWRPHDCVVAEGVVFYGTTRISNNLRDPKAIIIGAFTHVKGELTTFGHGGKITLGEYCYVGEQTRIWSAREITIGDRVLISHHVNIFDSDTHPLSPKARHEQFRSMITIGHPKSLDLRENPVKIADDVLIGCSCIILAGVSIGKAAVVGAGSVVTRDVPPYTIVAGNPARIIRQIPEDE